MQTVCESDRVNLVLCVRFECVWVYGLQESALELNGFNFPQKKYTILLKNILLNQIKSKFLWNTF